MVVCRSDPCGIICILLTYIAVGYADYVVLRWIVILTMSSSLWGAVNAILFNLIVFLLVMSHLRAVLTDPGVIPLPSNSLDFSDMHSEGKNLMQQKEDWTVCARCETYRPPRAHHCRICQRCVRRMDHHCPWINNCVGEFNQKYFIQFLMYVGLASAYAVSLVCVSWLTECVNCVMDEATRQIRVIHCVILVVESLLFGLFVVAIMFDQFTAILTDETAVEQVQRKGPFRPRKPKMALLSEVCGRSSPLLWFFPCQNPPGNIHASTNYDV